VRTFVLAAASLVALAAAGVVALTRVAPDTPTIVLVTYDTTRRDHLTVYGYGRPTSPNLAELAQSAVVFEQAYTPASTSGPAHASMLTGLSPFRHGLRQNGARLPARWGVVAEELRGLGYRTAGFVSHALVGKKAGLDRGFQTFRLFADSNHRHSRPTLEEGTAEFRAAARWLTQNPRRAFVWVHAQHPHFDYLPPLELEEQLLPGDEKFDEPVHCALKLQDAIEDGEQIPEQVRARQVARYDGELMMVDRGLGLLLDAIRQGPGLDRTAVIVTADHGETLFDRVDHGLFGHGTKFYEEVLRVPLVMHAPGLGAGRAAGFVDTTQIAATVVELAGGAPPPELANSLLPEARALHGRSEFGETTWPGKDRRAVRQGNWMLLFDGDQPHLYDLAKDPLEQRDLAEREADRVAALAALMGRLEEGAADTEADADPETLEMLREGGYLSREERRHGK